MTDLTPSVLDPVRAFDPVRALTGFVARQINADR